VKNSDRLTVNCIAHVATYFRGCS